MKVAIVADAHIKGKGDPVQAAFVRFLDELSGIDMLVILGDLFDFWMGYFEYSAYDRYEPVLAGLSRLKERGVQITYFEGNHDISMGDFFTKTLGAQVFTNSAILSIDNKIIYFSHGDAAAAGFWHSIWRFASRSVFMKLLAITLGPVRTFKVGEKLSHTSRDYNVERTVVEEALRRDAKKRISSGADIAVYAHSHAAGVHTIEADGKSGIYANPGSFAGNGNYLLYDNGKFSIKKHS